MGSKREVNAALLVPNPELSLEDGAINANGWNSDDEDGWGRQMLKAVCTTYKIPMDKPWRQLTQAQRDLIMHGTGGERVRMNYTNRMGERRNYDVTFEGIVQNLMRRYRESTSDYIKQTIEEVMSLNECDTCHGKRLKDDVLCVRIAKENIADVSDMSIGKALVWINGLGIDEDVTQDARRKTNGIVRPTIFRRSQRSR